MEKQEVRLLLKLNSTKHEELTRIKDLKFISITDLIREGVDLVIEKHFQEIEKSKKRQNKLLSLDL